MKISIWWKICRKIYQGCSVFSSLTTVYYYYYCYCFSTDQIVIKIVAMSSINFFFLYKNGWNKKLCITQNSFQLNGFCSFFARKNGMLKFYLCWFVCINGLCLIRVLVVLRCSVTTIDLNAFEIIYLVKMFPQFLTDKRQFCLFSL